jgi:hypothetical protein
MTPYNRQQVRERAYQIWEEEGRPEAREQFPWDRSLPLLDPAPPLVPDYTASTTIPSAASSTAQ